MKDDLPLTEDGLPSAYQFRPDLELTPRQVASMLKDPASKLVLIDCREQVEWDTARIEGSQLIPLGQLLSSADDLDLDEDVQVAVICHHGQRSLQAAVTLQHSGVPSAKSVAGGIDCWSQAVDSSVPRYERFGNKCRLKAGADTSG